MSPPSSLRSHTWFGRSPQIVAKRLIAQLANLRGVNVQIIPQAEAA